MASVRARVRAQLIEEIKAAARLQLATDGANLSLRAIARDLGMVSSALYRYFASRDELLTALIVDAYHALGGAAEAGDAAIADRADLRGRWLGAGHAIRRWALANPAEYALIFGSPVPGYAAPPATTEAALRTPAALVRILIDGVVSGALADPADGDLPPPVRADLAAIQESFAPGVPAALLARGITGWVQLFGAVSFELFGQLNNVIEARDDYYDYQLRQAAAAIGF
jgi:AcrR family transcriptional regulator